MSFDKKERIILVGPMGAGKSSIGKSLALVSEKAFLDVDEEIVRYAKMSIPDIFATKGEEEFRNIESVVLEKCLRYDAVIATGGGIIGRELNRKLLKENGIVVYLLADVDTQYLRTSHDNNRPMLNVDDRRQRLADIFSKRDPLYKECADITIDSGKMDIHDCVETIIEKIRES